MTEISKRLSKNIPLSALSAFSFIPERRESNEITYFGNQKKEVSMLLYDRVFQVQQGYNNKIHRDDRENSGSQGLHVNAEVYNPHLVILLKAPQNLRGDFPRIMPVNLCNTELYYRNSWDLLTSNLL
ncbi:uncharacterized protein CFAP90 isoform X2 [Leucoraja erinacea]|uniref:uncharacterized protein CFAP90 isoform X2 n=1 Tax=Leucoraja erinaceus TaxID=7782 RepID=UPI00245464FF|nr:uncharacterized protein CFAP90 isoform X2 [Leucoraja erinacea]